MLTMATIFILVSEISSNILTNYYPYVALELIYKIENLRTTSNILPYYQEP